MIIDCDENPKDLIKKIGDSSFSICDDTWDAFYRHPDHPNTVRIIDCENNQTIDVTGESIIDTQRIAQSLCKLLNQDYRKKYEL